MIDNWINNWINNRSRYGNSVDALHVAQKPLVSVGASRSGRHVLIDGGDAECRKRKSRN